MTAGNVPMAPPASEYYEFLGGGKKPAAPEGGKDGLDDLLGAADMDLDF